MHQHQVWVEKSAQPSSELSEAVGCDNVSTHTSLADIKGANRFLMTASLLASSHRFDFLELHGLQFAETCQALLSYWQVKCGHHAACEIC